MRKVLGAVGSKLTYANVMATLAVFMLLAGGGAYAASKVKRGPQGPQGPQGAQGPPGTPGTPGQQGPSAGKLDFIQPNTETHPSGTFRSVLTQNELTIEAKCERVDGGPTHFAVLTPRVTSSVPATLNWTQELQFNGGDTTVSTDGMGLSAGTPTELPDITVGLQSAGLNYRRGHLSMIYRSDTRVISLELHFNVQEDANTISGICYLQGVAIPTS
jgi:hypothetical protein